MSTDLSHPPGVAALERWGILDRLQTTNCPQRAAHADRLPAFAEDWLSALGAAALPRCTPHRTHTGRSSTGSVRLTDTVSASGTGSGTNLPQLAGSRGVRASEPAQRATSSPPPRITLRGTIFVRSRAAPRPPPRTRTRPTLFDRPRPPALPRDEPSPDPLVGQEGAHSGVEWPRATEVAC
jgi:hypothetical protein